MTLFFLTLLISCASCALLRLQGHVKTVRILFRLGCRPDRVNTSVPMLEVLEALARTALLHSVGNCKSLFVKTDCVTKLDAAQESLVLFQCHLQQDSSGGLKVFV